MRSGIAPTKHVARYGQNGTPLLEGKIRGNQRAASFGGLDNDNREREPTDDAVALRKVRLQGRSRGDKFAHQCAALADALGKRSMFARIDHIDAAPEYRNRDSFGVQRAAVRRRIDATRHSAHNRNAAARKVPAR